MAKVRSTKTEQDTLMKLDSLYADFPNVIPAHGRVRVRIYFSDDLNSSELRDLFTNPLVDNPFDRFSEDQKAPLSPNQAIAHRWANLNGFVVYDSRQSNSLSDRFSAWMVGESRLIRAEKECAGAQKKLYSSFNSESSLLRKSRYVESTLSFVVAICSEWVPE